MRMQRLQTAAWAAVAATALFAHGIYFIAVRTRVACRVLVLVLVRINNNKHRFIIFVQPSRRRNHPASVTR
jgi:hypothetical protein